MNKNILVIQISRYLKMLLIVLVSVSGFALSYFVTYSNYNIYNKFVLEIKSQESANAVLDRRISQLDKIRRIAATIESTDVLSKQAISNEVEIPIIMSLIQNLANSTGVKLGKLSYSGGYTSSYSQMPTVSDADMPVDDLLVSNQDGLSSDTKAVAVEDAIKIQGSVVGKTNDLINFLKSVETSRKLLEISNVSYGSVKSAENSISTGFELNFVISAFYKDFTTMSFSEPLNIDFDKYKNLISTLNKYKYTEIDLSKVDVGKSDPFSNSNDTEVNLLETSNGLENNAQEDSGINVVEIEGTGSSTTNETETDTEASPSTNITGTLMDILKEEGVSP